MISSRRWIILPVVIVDRLHYSMGRAMYTVIPDRTLVEMRICPWRRSVTAPSSPEGRDPATSPPGLSKESRILMGLNQRRERTGLLSARELVEGVHELPGLSRLGGARCKETAKHLILPDMENYKLVLPEHLNHYGYLFGGALLMWVDEISWIAASLDYPGCKFVTVGMDRVEFKKSVRQGSLLRFDIGRAREGRTSVTYAVNVFSKDIEKGKETKIFSTGVTFVCLDAQGKKRELTD